MQVTELGLGHASQDESLWKVNYEFGEFDSNNGLVDTTKNTGNIAKQTVSFNGLPNAFVQTYQYDSLYRLKEANEKAGTTENWKQDFTYDRYGNRLTHNKFINGSQITHNQQTHPSIDTSTNRFSDTNQYGYDKAGNLIADADGRTFTFDGNNKQILVTGNSGTVGEYFYDGDGMRVKKHVYTGGNHTKTIIFVYSGGKLAEEYSTEAVTSPKTKYLTEDHLGTPRIITDGTGEVVSRRDFMPFGQEIAKTTGTRSDSSFKYSSNEDNVKQKFTGYQQDSETMLDFAEARMYENRHARFTAVDPLLASGKSGNPQTFNRYVYCGNNPIACTDPTGLDGIWTVRQREGGQEYKHFKSQEEMDEYNNSLKGTPFCEENPASCNKYSVWTGGNFILFDNRVAGKLQDSGTISMFSAENFSNEEWNGLVRDWYAGKDLSDAASGRLSSALHDSQKQTNGLVNFLLAFNVTYRYYFGDGGSEATKAQEYEAEQALKSPVLGMLGGTTYQAARGRLASEKTLVNNLAESSSKGQISGSRKFSLGIDFKSGQIFTARSGGSYTKPIAPRMNIALRYFKMKGASMERWSGTNCAEFRVCNNAINNGVKSRNFVFTTIGKGKRFSPRCFNCQLTTPVFGSAANGNKVRRY